MMETKKALTFQQLRPFLLAAGAWLLAGTVLVFVWLPPESRGAGLAWWFALYALATMDLGMIAALVGTLLDGPPEGDRVRWGLRLAFLGAMKLAAWGLFALLLFGNRGIPNASLLSGLGTLVTVPLFGGFLWSFVSPSSDSGGSSGG